MKHTYNLIVEHKTGIVNEEIFLSIVKAVKRAEILLRECDDDVLRIYIKRMNFENGDWICAGVGLDWKSSEIDHTNFIVKTVVREFCEIHQSFSDERNATEKFIQLLRENDKNNFACIQLIQQEISPRYSIAIEIPLREWSKI